MNNDAKPRPPFSPLGPDLGGLSLQQKLALFHGPSSTTEAEMARRDVAELRATITAMDRLWGNVVAGLRREYDKKLARLTKRVRALEARRKGRAR